MAEANTPLTFAEQITLFYQTRAERLKLDRESAKLKAKEDSLAYQIGLNWDVHGVPEGYVATKEVKKKPNVDNWPDFLNWMRDNDALDCLQKRLTESAVQRRLDDGVLIPGIELVDKTVITVEKSDD